MDVPFFLAGEWVDSPRLEANVNPATGEVIGQVYQADEAAIEQAIQAAVRTAPKLRQQPAHVRADVCRRISQLILERERDLAKMISAESGKPIQQSVGEVQRASFTFQLAAEQAGLAAEERSVAADRFKTGAGRVGYVKRVPVGPVLAMSPFNFPLNLTAHKLGPAFAVGCPVVLKPSPFTPQTNLMLARICEEAGLIDGALSVVPCDVGLAEAMVRDERFAMLSFTGSVKVGWYLKSIAGRKRVVLELGNNSANIVHEDARNLDDVVSRLVIGSFASAGQVCIKVQRLYVHRLIFEEFTQALIDKTNQVRTGDPMKAETLLGPMIDTAHAERVQRWVEEATAAGARVLTGGERNGAFFEPTVLTEVPHESACVQEEIFGPVVVLEPYDDFEQVLARVNDTAYGLQAGLFTQDISRIFRAFEVLDVGGLIVNDYSTFRIDNMPYGGMKASGLGREGLYDSILEYTEPKTMIVKW